MSQITREQAIEIITFELNDPALLLDPSRRDVWKLAEKHNITVKEILDKKLDLVNQHTLKVT